MEVAMVNKRINESFFIKGSDGKDVFVHCWDDVSHPKGVVQIFHGMAEHAKRYKEFAEYLNDQGYVVYADDHRGHGETAGDVEDLGYIGEDGFNQIVDDGYVIMKGIKEKYSSLPVIVFGHSFGSFIAQEFIIRYGEEVAATILCGSAARTGVEVSLGKKISYIEKDLFGERNQSKLLDFLSFNNYNKGIKDSKSKFAWLSRDQEEVRKYEEDPYCGTLFTAGFFYYFFEGISKLYVKERLAEIPKGLPIFIIAGDKDPVGQYGRLVKKLHSFYKKAELKDVQYKLYSGGRHELLNEMNKDEVFDDVATWIKKKVFLE
jgi:alpha-beta hydrolase superfamily lysophospholipase